MNPVAAAILYSLWTGSGFVMFAGLHELHAPGWFYLIVIAWGLTSGFVALFGRGSHDSTR